MFHPFRGTGIAAGSVSYLLYYHNFSAASRPLLPFLHRMERFGKEHPMESYEFYLKPSPGETLQVAVPLPQPQDAAISGTVTQSGDPSPNALVLLLSQDRTVLARTTTDDLGQFFFGPLPGDTLYIVRVQKECGTTRVVELRQTGA
jgi:hypothetical protein